MATLHSVFKRNLSNIRLNYRLFSDNKTQTVKKGIIVGVYTEEKKDQLVLTPSAEFYNGATGGKLVTILEKLQADFKKGQSRIFYGLTSDHLATCVVGLGKRNQGYDELEEIDQGKESIRIAAGAGAIELQNLGINDIEIENLEDAEAAAEGAALNVWQYQELKNSEKQKKIPNIRYYPAGKEKENPAWNTGLIKAEAQNLARRLTDTPANLMTPTIFASQASEILGKKPNVKVFVREKSWAEEQKMFSFLSVSRGSSEPPKFLEVHYNGKNDSSNPIVFVGKGVTFDTGGISIKPSASMDEMRGDMGGGACVFATIHAIAELGLPINLVGLVPLTENMPGSSATKPGDVVRAMNGKTIQVDNTDAEGRLILADALCYAQTFKPKFILDIATLTGAMRVALGGGATGVFTNSTKLWSQLQCAGAYSGDRVWRFPLWKLYSKRVTDFPSVDVNNVGKGKGGGSCTAAAFLKEFVSEGEWLHLDIAGVMGPGDDIPYLSKGMTGRPTRTLIQFLNSFC